MCYWGPSSPGERGVISSSNEWVDRVTGKRRPAALHVSGPFTTESFTPLEAAPRMAEQRMAEPRVALTAEPLISLTAEPPTTEPPITQALAATRLTAQMAADGAFERGIAACPVCAESTGR